MTTVPTERFHQMLQDTLRGDALASMPFYNQKKVVALLDELPAMSNADRVGCADVNPERLCLAAEI